MNIINKRHMLNTMVQHLASYIKPIGGPTSSENTKDINCTMSDSLNTGSQNMNPKDINFFSLIQEDFRTYENNLLEPGFWAVLTHRFGNWRMDVKPKIVRAPLSLLYQTMFTSINWLWGIDLCYTVKLGRRVRIWHHGGMVLGARSIGDDVVIRHNTTLGLVRRQDFFDKPTIGNRVDIGVGACILGNITVGDDCVIGANTVVVRNLAPNSRVFGVPARPVNLKAQAKSTPDSNH